MVSIPSGEDVPRGPQARKFIGQGAKLGLNAIASDQEPDQKRVAVAPGRTRVVDQLHRRWRYGRVVLGGLRAIEHAVVAHHLEYAEVLGRRIGKELPAKGDASVG